MDTDSDEVERPVRNRKSRAESRAEDVRASLLALLRLLRRRRYRARTAPLLLVENHERPLDGRPVDEHVLPQTLAQAHPLLVHILHRALRSIEIAACGIFFEAAGYVDGRGL